MLELRNDFEILFNIEISLNDRYDFLFSGKKIKVQDGIDYIGKKVIGPKKLTKNEL